MKLLAMVIGAGALLGLSGVAAQAMPIGSAPGARTQVETVADGCGPGSFRGPRGFCRPMGGYGYGYRGPRCFVRMTPFGPRRFCR